jgi:hypothetical protein
MRAAADYMHDLPLKVTLCITELLKWLYIRRTPTSEKGKKIRLLKPREELLLDQCHVPTFNLHSRLPSASYHIMRLLFRQKGTLIFITLLNNQHLTNHRCVAPRSTTSQVGLPSFWRI